MKDIGIRIFLAAILCHTSTLMAAAGTEDLKRHVEFLASEDLEGRFTGSEGAKAAADYLAAELEKLGTVPLPDQKSMILEYEFTAGTGDDGSSITLKTDQGERTWDTREQIQALSFSDTATVSGPVVFAGYGLKVPESDGFAYDSYANLDVEDKIVLALRYFPEDAEKEVRGRMARYAGLRFKALQARDRGAKALVIVTGPRSPNAGEVVPMTFDAAVAGSGIVGASVSGEIGEALFAALGEKDLEAAQQALDDANPHIAGFDMPGVELTLDVKVKRERRTGRNIVGFFPGKGEEIEEPWVVVGAHFDHLGRGRHGNSLAKREEMGAIHYGADDNASGAAAMLRMASDLAGKKLRRNVVVAFWSGEEIGLLGANRFIEAGAVPTDQIAAYLNFDMVGRMKENKLSVQAVGTSSDWSRLLEQANVPIGFDLKLQEDPYLPTDSTAFDQEDIPTLNFFSGSHEDYHRPTDRPETINYEDLERIARFGTLVATKLAESEKPPDFIRVKRRAEGSGSRDSLRAFTGTIPDYASEVEGLLLSGVIEGGPAEEAGLQEGDVIVEFAGQPITNVYDYSYALDAVKVDVPIKVVFLRDEERHETTMTPRARK